MLSARDNERLCRVGPGTPMGRVVREYWIPALMTRELAERDGPPVRVRLLGENLIAFRTTSGAIGLIQDACPHRGASLFFGRNEQDGIRCVYHGWKFDVGGRCVDMPTEPVDTAFMAKVTATVYPCVERNGVIWTYMGPRTAPPPLPDIEANLIAPEQATVHKIHRQCNWVQALEGDIDSSHLGFLHSVLPASPGGRDPHERAREGVPRHYQVEETDAGLSYGAGRDVGTDKIHWRVSHFLFPFFTLVSLGNAGQWLVTRAWVPLDDENMMFWRLGSKAQPTNLDDTLEYLPDTDDAMGRFRLAQNRSNDYRIDRDVQRRTSYTGIAGVHQQDQAITESMGPIVDRTREHLGTSDIMVIRTRRRLLAAAQALEERGEIPPGVDLPASYRCRAFSGQLRAGQSVFEAMAAQQQEPPR